MRKKNTENIGDILQQVFGENAVLRKRMAQHRAVKAWNDILGNAIASYTTNVYVKENTLHVSLSSSVLRAELALVKDQLIQKLNEHAGMHIINDIILR